MYPDQHNYLIHWLKKGEKAKYVDKIKLANGRWRYFYSQAELDAYKLKQRLANGVNDLKKKAYDALGGKEKDEFMREWNRGNELYLQGKDAEANKAYDRATAARDRYWKTPLGATMLAATTAKESVDDFLYEADLSGKASHYAAKAKRLLRGISEGAKDIGARAVVTAARSNYELGERLGADKRRRALRKQSTVRAMERNASRENAKYHRLTAEAASKERRGQDATKQRADAAEQKLYRDFDADWARQYRRRADQAWREYERTPLGRAEARVRRADTRKATESTRKMLLGAKDNPKYQDAAKRSQESKPATQTPQGQKVGSLFADNRPTARKKKVTKGGTGVHKRDKVGSTSTSNRPHSRKKRVTNNGTGVYKRDSIKERMFNR